MAKRKQNKLNEKSPASYLREPKDLEKRSGISQPLIVFTLRDFDRNQGQSFKDWEEEKLLAMALTKIQGICSLTRQEATQQQIIKEYKKGEFPVVSDFSHPKHIPDDIAWCTIRLQGKERIVGYFEQNVFYVVFLDKDHKFWVSDKKHT